MVITALDMLKRTNSMRNRESEAYEKGNLCMRDWEDRLKQSKPTIYNEWRIKTMSTKKWKNNELMENVTRKFDSKWISLNLMRLLVEARKV